MSRSSRLVFWRPVAVLASAILKGSMILPYCTPEGQADSHARQSRQSSR